MLFIVLNGWKDCNTLYMQLFNVALTLQALFSLKVDGVVFQMTELLILIIIIDL